MFKVSFLGEGGGEAILSMSMYHNGKMNTCFVSVCDWLRSSLALVRLL